MASIISANIPLALVAVLYSTFVFWELFGAQQVLKLYGVDVTGWSNMELILPAILYCLMLGNCTLLLCQLGVCSVAFRLGNNVTKSWVLLFVGLLFLVMSLEGLYYLYLGPWADKIHMNMGGVLAGCVIHTILALLCLLGVDKSSIKCAGFGAALVYWGF